MATTKFLLKQDHYIETFRMFLQNENTPTEGLFCPPRTATGNLKANVGMTRKRIDAQVLLSSFLSPPIPSPKGPPLIGTLVSLNSLVEYPQ
jgi:hypothetical protein